MLVKSSSNVFGDFSMANLLQKNMSAEALMVQVQLLMTKEFDNQLQDISKKIKFLNDVKKQYRENINVLQKLTAQNPITEKNGKRWVHASFKQMNDVSNALVEYDYNLESMETKEKPMNDWGDFFQHPELASKIQDKNSDRPYYWKYSERNEDGSPKLSVLVDALDKMLEQIRNRMSDVEEEAEQLSVKLNQLTSQRKSMLEGASQIIRKLEEVTTNTVSKI